MTTSCGHACLYCGLYSRSFTELRAEPKFEIGITAIRLVRRVGHDGAMAQQILPPSESWRLIDAWLATHVASDFALLNPPATPDEIGHAERILGGRLPGDLAESLRCHNGVSAWTTILPEQSPLAVSGIVDHWQTCMNVAAESEGLTLAPGKRSLGGTRSGFPGLRVPMARRRSSTNVLVLTRGVSAGQPTAVAATSPIPGLTWRAFSTRSRKLFMKVETSAGCIPTSQRKVGCGGTKRAAAS